MHSTYIYMELLKQLVLSIILLLYVSSMTKVVKVVSTCSDEPGQADVGYIQEFAISLHI